MQANRENTCNMHVCCSLLQHSHIGLIMPHKKSILVFMMCRHLSKTEKQSLVTLLYLWLRSGLTDTNQEVKKNLF